MDPNPFGDSGRSTRIQTEVRRTVAVATGYTLVGVAVFVHLTRSFSHATMSYKKSYKKVL